MIWVSVSVKDDFMFFSTIYTKFIYYFYTKKSIRFSSYRSTFRCNLDFVIKKLDIDVTLDIVKLIVLDSI